jgi:hypothetical protein
VFALAAGPELVVAAGDAGVVWFLDPVTLADRHHVSLDGVDLPAGPGGDEEFVQRLRRAGAVVEGFDGIEPPEPAADRYVPAFAEFTMASRSHAVLSAVIDRTGAAVVGTAHGDVVRVPPAPGARPA